MLRHINLSEIEGHQMRSCALIDQDGDIYCGWMNHHVAKEYESIKYDRQNVFRYIPHEEQVKGLKKAMSEAMFNRVPVKVEARTTILDKPFRGWVTHITGTLFWMIVTYEPVEEEEQVEHELSTRQIKILQMMADDQSQTEIAKDLGIDESTVANHLRQARVKQGFETTAALIGWATCKGIICPC